jgi:hypothetical protein
MATLAFIVVAALGFALTKVFLGRSLRSGKTTQHRQALILAIGFGATILLSFFAPLVATGATEDLSNGIWLLGIIYPAGFAITTYLIARVLLRMGLFK